VEQAGGLDRRFGPRPSAADAGNRDGRCGACALGFASRRPGGSEPALGVLRPLCEVLADGLSAVRSGHASADPGPVTWETTRENAADGAPEGEPAPLCGRRVAESGAALKSVFWRSIPLIYPGENGIRRGPRAAHQRAAERWLTASMPRQ
jgi:hypothetical protein